MMTFHIYGKIKNVPNHQPGPSARSAQPQLTHPRGEAPQGLLDFVKRRVRRRQMRQAALEHGAWRVGWEMVGLKGWEMMDRP